MIEQGGRDACGRGNIAFVDLHYHNYFLCVVFQNNALREWSFKKAITIRAYSSYHPVPVPFNLVSITVLKVWRLCQGSNRFDKTGFDEEGRVSHMSQRILISFFDSADLEHIEGKMEEEM